MSATNHPAPSALGAGFSDLAHGSQRVFRSVLQALSHPGRVVELSCDAEVPVWASGPVGDPVPSASAAVLLALLDTETRLWLSPSLAGSAVATWLRFHTGCVVVAQSAEAQFVWAASLGELPALDGLCLGTDASPEKAVTCVVDVPMLQTTDADDGNAWVLGGPGIREQAWLAVGGVSAGARERFVALRAASHAAFPRGVDVLLTAPDRVVGLPRTTRVISCAANGG